MDLEFDKDRVAIGGKREISMRYKTVYLSTHVSSDRFTPEEALQLLKWLQDHKEEIEQFTQKK